MQRQQFELVLKQLLTQDLLTKARQHDHHLANGLQIAGRNEIKKVVTGVSISLALIEQAVAKGADAIIVHHGLDLTCPYQLMSEDLRLRLKALLTHNINLYAYHYVLDAHPTLGNNAQLAQLLDAKIVGKYFQEWGFIGRLNRELTVSELAALLKKILHHEVLVITAQQQQPIKIIGLCSGGAVPYPDEIVEITEAGVQAHITGEVKERVWHQFIEMGVSYLAGGHYATEVFGIKALTQALQQELTNQQVEIKFLDLVNQL